VPQDAVKELLTVYEGKRGKADGIVTFLEFIEYYRVSDQVLKPATQSECA
jgi:hypothetical protein